MAQALEPQSDESLLDRLARQDTAALDELYARYGRMAFGLAYRVLNDPEGAEDVVQDAYLRAFTYRDTFRGDTAGGARAWLLAIVRNTAFSWRRRMDRGGASTPFDETLHSDSVADQHPEAALLRQTTQQSLNQALDQLPNEFREVIVLREVEGLSYREIGEVIGAPVGTVMSRLSRARKRLQETLRPERREK